jgi:hypothetical protein
MSSIPTICYHSPIFSRAFPHLSSSVPHQFFGLPFAPPTLPRTEDCLPTSLPDKAKVRKFTRLLEAVHRFVYAKDDIGLAEGFGFKKGKDIKAGESVRGELVGKDVYALGRVKVSVKVEIRQVNSAKESVVRHNRIKKNVDPG